MLDQFSSTTRLVFTIIIGALIVAAILVMLDPKGIYRGEETAVALDAPRDYTRLLAIEALHDNRARLGYVDGRCETSEKQLGEVLRAIQQEGKGEWFFGIPFNGTRRKGEYINLVYVDHFERIICNQGVYYRARLRVQGNQCRFVEGLIACGTEFFTERTYGKMVHALERLGVGDADYFQPRRTLRQETCECN